MATQTLTIKVRNPHSWQRRIRNSPAKRKVVRSGRRAGKTTLAGIIAAEGFLQGRRVLYATPTQEQVDAFWFEITRAFAEPIEARVLYKNETRHLIEVPNTKRRIRAKTAWSADSLRGDYADYLILDEYQMMDEDAWELVGAPMLLDNDGDAMFIYTQRRGKHHSKDLFVKAEKDKTGRWETFSFSSFENPYVNAEALKHIAKDMTQLGYRMEILSEEVEDDPRALWTREIIDHVEDFPDLVRIVVGVDPAATTGQTGIIVAGRARVDNAQHLYILEDATPTPGASPATWGKAVITAYHKYNADRILGEINHGGDMIESTIRNVDPNVAYKSVRASRGKAVRAEPVSALYEQGRAHHVGQFEQLEDEYCNWIPDESKWSPNRLDAAVWCATELIDLSDWVIS